MDFNSVEEILIQNGINKSNIKQIEYIKTKFNESYFESGSPTHHWEVPLKILNTGVNYKLYLRQHSNRLNETVCYAIPK